MSPCDKVLEDLAAIVDGDRDAIALHAEHLASCDACRDARHDAQMIAKRVAVAGDDFVMAPGFADRMLVLVNEVPVTLPMPARVEKLVKKKPPMVRPWLAAAAVASMAASGALYMETRHSVSTSERWAGRPEFLGQVTRVSRSSADGAAGVAYRIPGGAWQPLRVNDKLPEYFEIRTDERTRAWITVDLDTLVLDHSTSLSTSYFAREMTLTAGRIDVQSNVSWMLRVADTDAQMPGGGHFQATAGDHLAVLEAIRGPIRIADLGLHEAVVPGEQAVVDHGKFSVSNTMARTEWSEENASSDKGLAGIGSLRAYKPGETRDRDWNLALAKHDVKVRISGPIARTEITEVFRNDSGTQLEGDYQFPLPADAQIDGLALDVDNKFVDGAFVDKARANKIWQGVIDRARPIQIAKPDEIVWVPGPWRDPALLDWKRGGKFELKIFPIPAHGQRTIKIAYTQVVAAHGAKREYVYPLAHSSDGSTIADAMAMDVEIRGAQPNLMHATNYKLVADPARTDRNALTFAQSGFVPNGDLVIEYQPDTNADLRAWTFQGGAAAAPDQKLASTQNVGIDPKVVAEQTRVAADLRPTAVLELHPKLPRWSKFAWHQYVIVVDVSQSMVGARAARARELVAQLIGNMDPRSASVRVVAADSEPRMVIPATSAPAMWPTRREAENVTQLLTGRGVSAGGASDLVASVRAGAALMNDPKYDQGEKWVIYIGGGFATTGFRKAADIEHALHDPKVHVTTIGIGADADEQVLSAAARGGGGSYIAWTPGMTATSTALAALETTYGATLSDATLTLPVGLVDSAPTVLPTIRSGQQLLVSARMTGDVGGDVILRGTLAGEPFEQRYPLKLSATATATNGFVPRLWASLAIGELERAGRGEDHIREVALSQAYGVMSRETSLLVLESQAMFDAFGVDRHHSTVQWTGEDAVEESTSDVAGGVTGDVKVSYPTNFMPATATAPKPNPMSPKKIDNADRGYSTNSVGGGSGAHTDPFAAQRRARMIPMRRVWTRVAAIASYPGVAADLTKEIVDGEAALAAAPDSREKHRALVQELSFAGDLARATAIAKSWQERDQLDPQVLGYLADLAARDGNREESLRTLAGLVDLDPDKVALHLRMVDAYERTGRLAQACSHRIAIATLQHTPASAAPAVRCLRTLGRPDDASIVMTELATDAQRGDAERMALTAPIDPPLAGDLVIRGSWDRGNDLDITLVASDGTRISLQGGRSDVIVQDALALDREELALKTAKRGSYLVEITRADGTRGDQVHGSLEVEVLGVKRSLPFELTGTHQTIGRIDVTATSHYEQAWDVPVPARAVPK